MTLALKQLAPKQIAPKLFLLNKGIRGFSPGFSLVELMVVLLIVGLVASLVAPMTIKQLEASQARSEFLYFRNTLKGLTAKAFTRGVSYQLQMKGTLLTVTSVQGEEKMEFEHLSLPDTTFYINRNGFPSVDTFTVSLAKQEKEVTLSDILGVKQESVYAKR